jgi:hypothetical protein
MLKHTRRLIALLAVLSLPPFSLASAAERTAHNGHVLFVGNSLTYFGNLPAVLDALSQNSGRTSSSDMIVAPGATLTDWAKSGLVTSALSAGQYSFVILQERGGDLMGSFGPQAMTRSRRSLAALVSEIRRRGATPILLGTYQSLTDSSKSTEKAEGDAARSLDVGYVPISERLRIASASQTKLDWLASDGMHPGSDLTLLYALVLYQALYGELPEATNVSVQAPIYGFDSGIKAELRNAHAPAPHRETPFGKTYDSERVATVLKDL